MVTFLFTDLKSRHRFLYYYLKTRYQLPPEQSISHQHISHKEANFRILSLPTPIPCLLGEVTRILLPLLPPPKP